MIVILTILLFCVLSSKQVFLFNEEVIVALSFLGFVIFSQRAFGDTVKASFEERQVGVLSDLQQFLSARLSLVAELTAQHQFRAMSLLSSTQMIGNACINDMLTQCAPRCKHTVQAVLSQQYEQKLKILLTVQEQARASFQQKLVSCFRNTVSEEFRVSRLRAHQPKLIQQGIAMLTQTSTANSL